MTITRTNWVPPIPHLRFDVIWILESLRDNDNHTGDALHSNILDEFSSENNFKVEFTIVQNRASLFAKLDEIKSRLKATGEIPLIHFETHGDKVGLRLTSNEDVDFVELFSHLQEINVLSHHNLFVTVAACEGGYLMEVIAKKLTTIAPIVGVCGPTVPALPGELLDGYTAFYRKLIPTRNPEHAVAALRGAIANKTTEFQIFSTEQLYIMASRKLFQRLRDPITAKQEADEIVRMTKVHHPELLKDGELRFRAKILAFNSSSQILQQMFDRWVWQFFLHDKYPEDKNLPLPTYQDLWRKK